MFHSPKILTVNTLKSNNMYISFKKRYTVILPRMWKYKGGTQKTFLQHTGSMVHSCAAISKQEPLFPGNSGGGALYEDSESSGEAEEAVSVA